MFLFFISWINLIVQILYGWLTSKQTTWKRDMKKWEKNRRQREREMWRNKRSIGDGVKERYEEMREEEETERKRDMKKWEKYRRQREREIWRNERSTGDREKERYEEMIGLCMHQLDSICANPIDDKWCNILQHLSTYFFATIIYLSTSFSLVYFPYNFVRFRLKNLREYWLQLYLWANLTNQIYCIL